MQFRANISKQYVWGLALVSFVLVCVCVCLYVFASPTIAPPPPPPPSSRRHSYFCQRHTC